MKHWNQLRANLHKLNEMKGTMIQIQTYLIHGGRLRLFVHSYCKVLAVESKIQF